MSIWKTRSTYKDKPWGSEVRWTSPFSMGGKLLNIERGQRTSLKYYQKKNQCLFLLTGNVIVHAPNELEFGEVQNLKPGDVIIIQAESVYRIEALEDSVLIEVTQQYSSGLPKQGIVMLEDDYGRMGNHYTDKDKN